jgi:mannose-6-phosphate isomerase|tara:strand:+ start:1050 stop:1475 length:426 start_codon:yes stop_codon:yes gene_type:complete
LIKKTAIFPKKKKVGKRNWGEEILAALIPKKISLKILKIKKGNKGGLQYHRKKDECGILISGKLLVRYQNKKGKLIKKILKKGDTFHFPPGSIHQEEAITNCQIIEASTPHFNDRVRVEKKFGIINKSGLKSTSLKQIIFK